MMINDLLFQHACSADQGYIKTPYTFINGTFYLKDYYSIQLFVNCNPTLQLTFLNTIIKIRELITSVNLWYNLFILFTSLRALLSERRKYKCVIRRSYMIFINKHGSIFQDVSELNDKNLRHANKKKHERIKSVKWPNILSIYQMS